MAAVIDEGKCIGCGACAGECPTSAITVVDVAIVEKAECVSCGACAGGCPVDAITIE